MLFVKNAVYPAPSAIVPFLQFPPADQIPLPSFDQLPSPPQAAEPKAIRARRISPFFKSFVFIVFTPAFALHDTFDDVMI
jgi:hypothetical protein